MGVLKTIVWVMNILSAFGLIGFVLLQHGKGADMGAAFGSGASGSLFGASGSANFMSRVTAVCAAIFFSTCLALSVIVTQSAAKTSLMDAHQGSVPTNSSQQVPAKPPAKPTSGAADTKTKEIPN